VGRDASSLMTEGSGKRKEINPKQQFIRISENDP
jgi:hypothetical protein